MSQHGVDDIEIHAGRFAAGGDVVPIADQDTGQCSQFRTGRIDEVATVKSDFRRPCPLDGIGFEKKGPGERSVPGTADLHVPLVPAFPDGCHGSEPRCDTSVTKLMQRKDPEFR